jgi:hypothetical protein
MEAYLAKIVLFIFLIHINKHQPSSPRPSRSKSEGIRRFEDDPHAHHEVFFYIRENRVCGGVDTIFVPPLYFRESTPICTHLAQMQSTVGVEFVFRAQPSGIGMMASV